MWRMARVLGAALLCQWLCWQQQPAPLEMQVQRILSLQAAWPRCCCLQRTFCA